MLFYDGLKLSIVLFCFSGLTFEQLANENEERRKDFDYHFQLKDV